MQIDTQLNVLIQELISEVVPSQRCYVNIDPVLNVYGAMDVWNSRLVWMQVTELLCYQQYKGCLGCKKFMEDLASLDPALAHVSIEVPFTQFWHLRDVIPSPCKAVLLWLGWEILALLVFVGFQCVCVSPLLVSTFITLPPITGTWLHCEKACVNILGW